MTDTTATCGHCRQPCFTRRDAPTWQRRRVCDECRHRFDDARHETDQMRGNP